MISIKKVTGVVKDLGDSVEENLLTVYTYIELTDGQILRYVAVSLALRGKLVNSIKNGARLELHLEDNPKGKNFKMVLLALSGEEGRMYAMNPEGGNTRDTAVLVLLFIAGGFLVPFGIGLVVWWLCWKAYCGMRATKKTKAYVRGLPGAIFI